MRVVAMVFETRDAAPAMCSLNADDHATQTLMMQAVAGVVPDLMNAVRRVWVLSGRQAL
ncbi:MAG: hypothetical protein ACLPUT_09880 [Solirubrobacteraceae bacterium]